MHSLFDDRKVIKNENPMKEVGVTLGNLIYSWFEKTSPQKPFLNVWGCLGTVF
jgi:hypothetical protein